jgi:steroid 5-alpha reductase family enzyme
LLTTLIVILLLMVVLWLVSLIRKDASVVDPFWGTGFVIVAAIAWQLNRPDELRPLLILALTSLWGMRLSMFLLWRNWGDGEDRRYAKMRANKGSRFWWLSLFTVFLLQAVILWFVSMPIQVAAIKSDASNSLGWFDAAGIVVWCLGFVFEATGDWQLAGFKADPANAGKVMDRGLWRYTRHPNYFGDFCVWWGLYVIAAAGGAGWTIGSPLLMSFLLLKVSGVSLLESTIVDRRPEYAEYQARTNAFFPGRPRTTSQ